MSTQPEIHAGFRIIIPFDVSDPQGQTITKLARQLGIRVRPATYQLDIRDDAHFAKVETQLKLLYDRMQQQLGNTSTTTSTTS